MSSLSQSERLPSDCSRGRLCCDAEGITRDESLVSHVNLPTTSIAPGLQELDQPERTDDFMRHMDIVSPTHDLTEGPQYPTQESSGEDSRNSSGLPTSSPTNGSSPPERSSPASEYNLRSSSPHTNHNQTQSHTEHHHSDASITQMKLKLMLDETSNGSSAPVTPGMPYGLGTVPHLIVNQPYGRTVIPGVGPGSNININIHSNSNEPVQVGRGNVMNVTQGAPGVNRVNTGQRKKVEIRVPPRDVTNEDMELLCRHLGDNWRPLGSKLGFVKGELDTFAYDFHADGLRETIMQMLLAWRERRGPDIKLKIIVSALVAIKRADIAKMFSRNSSQ